MEELTEYEKMIEGVTQLAGLMWEYYTALTEIGFSKKEALELTIEYQKNIIGMAKPKQ